VRIPLAISVKDGVSRNHGLGFEIRAENGLFFWRFPLRSAVSWDWVAVHDLKWASGFAEAEEVGWEDFEVP
jgi:hypothetical protein